MVCDKSGVNGALFLLRPDLAVKYPKVGTFMSVYEPFLSSHSLLVNQLLLPKTTLTCHCYSNIHISYPILIPLDDDDRDGAPNRACTLESSKYASTRSIEI